ISQHHRLQLDLRHRPRPLLHDPRPQLPQPQVREAVSPGVRIVVAAPPRPPEELFPPDDEYRGLLGRRTRRARLFQVACLLALTIAVVALATLIYTIVNDSFGWVALVNEREPDAIV